MGEPSLTEDETVPTQKTGGLRTAAVFLNAEDSTHFNGGTALMRNTQRTMAFDVSGRVLFLSCFDSMLEVICS